MDHTLKFNEEDYKRNLTELTSKTDKEIARLNSQIGVKESMIKQEMSKNSAELAKEQALNEKIKEDEESIKDLLAGKDKMF